MSFFEQVYGLVETIPYGKVVSYGQIAAMLGAINSARTVGWALSGCPADLPWHRVVKADGSLPKPDFADLQRALLESEGVAFQPDGRVDIRRHGWDGVV